MTPDRRTLLALFSIAFGLRILYAAVIGTNPDFNPLPLTYDFRTAVRIHDNFDWFSEPFSPSPPGYILSLAAVFRALGPKLWTALLLGAFCGGVTTLFLYRIGEKRLGAGVGLLASVWLGVSVAHMQFAAIVISDVFVTLLFTWMVYAMVMQSGKPRAAAWAGLLFVLVIHTKPEFLLLFPILLVYFLFFSTRHRILNVQHAFLLVTFVIVLSLPWLTRNYAVYKEFVPISLTAERYTTHLFDRDSAEAPGGTNATTAAGFWSNTVEYWRVARFRESPADPRTGRTAEPAWSTLHNIIGVINFGVLLPFFLFGVALAIYQRQRYALIVTGAVLCHYLMSAFTFANETTRLPSEPLIIVLAMYGLLHIFRSLRARTATAS